MEDHYLDFSRAQDPSSGSGSGVLGLLSIPMQVVRNLGAGHQKVYIESQVTVAMTSAGDTLDIDVVSDSVATLDSSLTVIKTTLYQMPALSAVGYMNHGLLPESDSYEEFLGIRYYARVTAIETGTFNTYLTLAPNGLQRNYPVGSNAL